MNCVLVGPPDTLAAQSGHFRLESVEESYLLSQHEGIIAFERVEIPCCGDKRMAIGGFLLRSTNDRTRNLGVESRQRIRERGRWVCLPGRWCTLRVGDSMSPGRVRNPLHVRIIHEKCRKKQYMSDSQLKVARNYRVLSTSLQSLQPLLTNHETATAASDSAI